MTKSMLLRSCAFLAVPMLGVSAIPTAALAQQITTTITGQVTSETGAPVGGANVVITDTRTGAARTVTTGTDGLFSADNLTTGGPYTITATADGFQGQSVEGVNTSLQGATNLTFALTATSEDVAADTIVVTAARANISTQSTGPGTSFSEAVMETAPSFNRDVRDIIRLDPRVSLTRDDLSDQDRVSCLGGNDRGNAFTVDGISQGDVYGLNETGFSARSSTPVPYDAVRETQVNFAPFDVEYGQFTGCAINVVTRGGTNKIKGGGFFEVTGDDFIGHWADGFRQEKPDFRDKRWGVSLGGPLVKDRIFLFGAYEQSKTADTVEAGPIGAGYGIEMKGIDVEDFNKFREILNRVYGRDTGDLLRVLPATNKRWFGRADFQLDDNNRFEATYQKIKENSISPDDYFVSNQNSAQINGLNSAFNKGSDGTFYSARYYGQLTDNFSTELSYAHAKTQDIQSPVGGGEAQDANPLPRIIVAVFNEKTGTYGTVMSGPGSSRSANDLRTKIDQYKAVAKLELGSHKMKLGFEMADTNVYNLFVPNATGTLVFSNLTNFENGVLTNGTGTSTASPSVIYTGTGGTVPSGAFGNFAPGNDIENAAGIFNRRLMTVYAQDDWRATDRLLVTLGLRLEKFDGNRPNFNQKFFDRYGFGNDTGFSDLPGNVLPRISANYEIGDFAFFRRAKVRGGFGKFSGGDPLVWFGNAFQSDGSTYAQATARTSGTGACPAGPLDVVTGGVFTGFPTCVITRAGNIAAAGDAKVNAIDPDLKLPTVNRFNLGFESRMGLGSLLGDWHFNADFIYSKYKNPVGLVDLGQAVDTRLGKNGYTIDGRPIYRAINPTAAGCTAELVSLDPTPVYSNLTPACFPSSGTREDELLLINQDSYKGKIASFLLSKNTGRGIFTEGGNVFLNIGYAYSDVQDRRNMYRSTAGSNYDDLATADRQDPPASRGHFSQKHNFSTSLSVKEEFFGDNETTFGATFTARSGRPYSLTFTGGSDFNNFASGSDNQLAYIPTGLDDPNISALSNTDAVKAYLAFLDTISCDDDYRGKTIARNTCSNDWYFDLDLRFAQEIPGPARFLGDRNDKFEVYAMMDNFLNFLDGNWNVYRRRNFVGLQDVVDLRSPTTACPTCYAFDTDGKYVISSFTGDTFEEDNQVKFSSSLWRLKVGMRYNF